LSDTKSFPEQPLFLKPLDPVKQSQNKDVNTHNQIDIMFNFLKKDPTKELQKVINRKLEQARDVQRSGDIKAYALLMGEIDELQKKLEALS
jgi:hypothetical protein